MSEIKRLFLDLDGPLLDGKERHYHCYRTILEGFGYEPIEIETYWAAKRGVLNRRELLKMSGAESIYDEFYAAWMSMIESPEALSFDRIQSGAIDCLLKWKQQGIVLTLVTLRNNKQALEQQLELVGLRPFLDTVLVCDHAKGGEGKAEAVSDLFESELLTNNSIWIGDTEADWRAATILGMNVVLVTNGLRDPNYLSAMKGALIVPSINSCGV